MLIYFRHLKLKEIKDGLILYFHNSDVLKFRCFEKILQELSFFSKAIAFGNKILFSR
jgi:hypothetical protein